MRIGIVGAGKVGGGLGKIWVRAGHQVLFSSRHPNRLKVLIEEAGPGAYCGTVSDAALFGDLILFSPNFWGVHDALEATGPLKGKTVPLKLESRARVRIQKPGRAARWG